MKKGHVCQVCGLEAPTRQVVFYQNIGALVMRFHRKIDGHLCKRCINDHFWKMTGITTGIGWLGLHSLIIAPIFIINNLVRYVGALGMPAVPDNAQRPVIDESVATKINPILPQVFDLIKQKTDLNDIATELAPVVGVTPGQFVTYVVGVIRSASRQPPPLPTANAPAAAPPQ